MFFLELPQSDLGYLRSNGNIPISAYHPVTSNLRHVPKDAKSFQRITGKKMKGKTAMQ
jgi:hypothetical protein